MGPSASMALDRQEASPCRRAIVAEDDADCRLGLQFMLRDLGYEVTGARNGAEALAWFRSFGGAALLVTDLAMPRLDGLALSRRLRALDPGLPILAISGAGDGMEGSAREAGVAYLPKPFDRAEFARAVRAAVG